jgi:hypothetical protein
VKRDNPREDPEPEPETQLLRAICRAVVRRVRQENPQLRGAELIERMQAASPFRDASPDLQAIWDEELLLHLRGFPDECGREVH